MKIIGCDLGGTNLRAAVVDTESGEVLSPRRAPTRASEGPGAVITRIADLIEEVIASSGLIREEISGLGIGAPGTVDMERGRVLFLPNLPGAWQGVELAETLGRLTGLRVRLLNDVRAITLGEWKFGAGRDVETMACFAVGTGIGGGLVINGQLHLGIGGTAGELGHQTIDINGPRCGCGNRGCVEAYASGPAIAAMGMKAVSQGLTTRIGELVAYDLNRITPVVIAQAALEGDPIAGEIFEQAGACLGVAVANVLAVISPRKVVIAGGVAQAGDLLLEPVRRTVRERVHVMPVDQVEIVPGVLGNHAGVIGSALWVGERG